MADSRYKCQHPARHRGRRSQLKIDSTGQLATLVLLQNSSALVQEITQAVADTKETPKELAGLLQEIRLLVTEMKDTVVEAKKSQIELTESANNATDIIIELGIASAAAALAEQRVLSPTDADEIIIQSIMTIESRSERLGKIARSINDFRIMNQRR